MGWVQNVASETDTTCVLSVHRLPSSPLLSSPLLSSPPLARRVKLAPRPALKLKHCRVMAECHIADGEMLELCNDYYDVFDTPEVNGMPSDVATVVPAGGEEKNKDGDGDTTMGDSETAVANEKKTPSQLQLSMPGGGSEPAWVFALGRVVLFGALAEYSNHQSDLLHRVLRHKMMRLPAMAAFRELATKLTTDEIIVWPSGVTNAAVLTSHAIFNAKDGDLPVRAAPAEVAADATKQMNLPIGTGAR